jgi:iron complex transport system substrate-binding protein
MHAHKHCSRRAALKFVSGSALAGLVTACGADATATAEPTTATGTTVAPEPTAAATATASEPTAAAAPTGASVGMEVKHSKLFTIEYLDDGAKVAHDGDGDELLLLAEGQTVSAGYEELTAITVPVQRVVALSTTHISLMRPLGVFDTLVGLSSTADRVQIDEVAEAMADGRTQSVGSSSSAPDYELITALHPQVTFASTGTDDSVQIKAKFAELGLPFAAVNSWLEQDPLAKAEWMKYMAAFYNKEVEVTAFFDAMEQRIQGVETAMAQVTDKPKVLWAWASSKGEHWVPNGGKYEAGMIRIAGGDNLFADLEGTGNSIITPEEMAARGKDADIFIYAMNPPTVNSLDEVKELSAVYAELDVVKNDRVWCFQPWYWQVVDKTDEVIEDLAAIFHPDVYPDHEVRHFLKL